MNVKDSSFVKLLFSFIKEKGYILCEEIISKDGNSLFLCKNKETNKYVAATGICTGPDSRLDSEVSASNTNIFKELVNIPVISIIADKHKEIRRKF